jgi:hypothetical protein
MKVFENNWISIYREKCFGTIKLEESGYFDERPQLIFTLNSLFGLLGIIFSILILNFWTFLISFIVLIIPFRYYQYEFFIKLPFKTGINDAGMNNKRFGFYFYGEGLNCADNIVFLYKKKTKFIYFPWSYEWFRTSYLRKDGTWENEQKNIKKDGKIIRKNFYEDEKWESILFSESYDYTYFLENGDMQKRMAKIQVIEREWRMKWFMWTNFKNKKRKVIDVEFSDEVGERSGSYKGGTVGCSYEMKKGESPLDCLRRMENERKF